MSWLTPERRAQFQQLQQARLAEEEAVSHAAQLQTASGKLSILPNTHHVHVDEARREDGHTETTQLSDGQHPIEMFNGPEVVSEWQTALDERDQPVGPGGQLQLEQQSSGNIAQKLYEEEYGSQSLTGSHSTPALHLEHFVARTAMTKPAAEVNAKTANTKTVNAKMATAVKLTSSDQKRPTVEPASTANRRASQKKAGIHPVSRKKSIKNEGSSMMFFDANGTYFPPLPTAKITTTRTQILREEQLSKSRNLSKGSFGSQSRPSVGHTVQTKVSKPTDRPARIETYGKDHASRIMNSRTDHHTRTESFPLTATERYQNFVKSTTNSASSRRGNTAKQQIVKEKIDDVSRRLSEDAVSPPLNGSSGQMSKTLKDHERNWNRPNPATSKKETVPLPANRKENAHCVPAHRSVANHHLSSTHYLASASAHKTQPKFSDKSQVKLKRTVLKTASNANKKRKSKVAQESTDDDGTSTSDFSATSVDSSAISFATEATSVTSGTSGTSTSRPKSKKKSVKKMSAGVKRHTLHTTSQHGKSGEIVERIHRRVSEKSPVAFGRAMPRPETPIQPSVETQKTVKPTTKTVSSVPVKKSVSKTPAKKTSRKKESRDQTTSDDTSAEFSISSQHPTDLTEDSEATTEDESSVEVKPKPSAEDIVKALASKWQAEKAASARGFASDSQIFSTSDLSDLQTRTS